MCKIHSKLPSGGILVFLTGKKEINELCEKLRVEFNNNLKNTEEDNNTQQIVNNKKEEEMITNDNYEIENDDVSINTEDRLSVSGNKEESESKQYSESVILPLYSSLSQIEQNRVFQKDLGNKRLIVVSTNVAETSLTIPNIKYVVDSGKEKKRVFYKLLRLSVKVYHFHALELNLFHKQAQNKELEEQEEQDQDIAIGYILTVCSLK